MQLRHDYGGMDEEEGARNIWYPPRFMGPQIEDSGISSDTQSGVLEDMDIDSGTDHTTRSSVTPSAQRNVCNKRKRVVDTISTIEARLFQQETTPKRVKARA